MSGFKPGIAGAGEDIAERLDRLRSRLGEIGQRWDNRLILYKISTAEEYLNGRLTLVAEVSVLGGVMEKRAYAAFHCHLINPVSSDIDSQNPCDAGSHDEQVVLLPITQVIQGNDASISSRLKVSVEFYPVKKENFDLFDGSLYRCLTDGTYKSLPIVSDRKGVFTRIRPTLALNNAHPSVIEGSSEIAAYIPHQQRDDYWDFPSKTDFELIHAAFRVQLIADSVRLAVDKRITNTVKVVNEFLGPLNL